MKAVRYEAPGSFEIADLPLPPIGPHDVRIKINQTGVCGTDLPVVSAVRAAARTAICTWAEFGS